MPTLKTRGWGYGLIQLAPLRERVRIKMRRTARWLLAKRPQKKKGEDWGTHPRNIHSVPPSCFRPRLLGPPRSHLNAQDGNLLRLSIPSTELTCLPYCTFQQPPPPQVIQKQNKTGNQFTTTFPCGRTNTVGFTASPVQVQIGALPLPPGVILASHQTSVSVSTSVT